MPRADEPRTTIRWSAVDHAMLKGAAEAAGVGIGSLIREGALKYAREIAGVQSEPAPRLRRRSVVRNPRPTASKPKGPIIVPSDGVERAEFFRKLNERRGS